jgi:oligoribonuclease
MDRLVWIDCEMTGLSLTADVLVEIACVVTDSELNVLDEGIDLVMGAPPAALAQMDPVVVDMHTKSGLIEEIRSATLTVPEAEAQVLAYLKTHVPERRKAPLCGNSISTDRSFIARDMTKLDDHLHYRMVDVSSIKELARRWYPRSYFQAPAKNGGHRALADILESITELKYYRAAVFVPQPGPDTSAAQAIAASISPAAAPADTAGETHADERLDGTD